jgi:ubiquinone/menaquinone biosynthesis C-methylase UbiE
MVIACFRFHVVLRAYAENVETTHQVTERAAGKDATVAQLAGARIDQNHPTRSAWKHGDPASIGRRAWMPVPCPVLCEGDLMFSDFAQAWNQGLHVDLYEKENDAIDHDGTLWRALEATAPWQGKDLLDLGCGTGYWLPHYVPGTRRLYGVEPDLALLDAAVSRTAEAKVLHGSAEHIPLPDSTVDVVHARFAYFFPSPTNDCTAGVAEVMRVLRPGGSLVVIDNDQDRGDFADLLRSSNAAAYQGHGDFILQWWREQGATTEALMSSWTFGSPEDLQEVVGMEFPQGTAQPWLRAHPQRAHLSYGYLLHTLVKPT